MKRLAGALVLLGGLGGGVTALAGPFMSSHWNKGVGCTYGGCRTVTAVPEAIGPWGQPVPMAAPYAARPPDGAAAARAMLSQGLPLDIVQMTGLNQGGIPGAVGPPVTISPPGVPGMPSVPAHPRQAAAAPNPNAIQLTSGPPGAVAAVGALTGGHGGGFRAGRSEVRFVGPPGMKISWYGPSPGGGQAGSFTTSYIEAPGRYNFVQAAIYRLKLSDIPNRPGLELYPTLEVVPANHKTATFLAHSAVPIAFTEEDFEQVTSGNFVVKVIYLPDPRYQDLAAIGPDEVVSSRLEPGCDPIAEACRRGSILVVVRLGNIDLEAPNTPAMDAPSPYLQAPQHGAAPQPGMPGTLPPGPMVPPGAMNAGRGMMPPGGPMPMPPQVPPGSRVPQGLPTNMMPPMPPPPATQPPPAPGGPVGQLPDMGPVQHLRYTKPATDGPAEAEPAVPEEGPAVAPAPEKKSSSRFRLLLDWRSEPK